MQKVAFILIGIGVVALIIWLVQDFFASSGVPLLVKIAVGAIAVGVLVLIGVAIRDRRKKGDNDNLKGVRY